MNGNDYKNDEAQGYNANPYQNPAPPPVAVADNNKVYCILSYLGFLWIIGLFVARQDARVRFHVNQGILLTIFGALLTVVRKILGAFAMGIFGNHILWPVGALINGVLSFVFGLAILGLMAWGVYHAAQNREEPLPFIGKLFRFL